VRRRSGRASRRIANEDGIDTINAFFDSMGRPDQGQYGAADFVTATMFWPMVDDLARLRNIHALLKPDGSFLFRGRYSKKVLNNNLFDTIITNISTTIMQHLWCVT